MESISALKSSMKAFCVCIVFYRKCFKFLEQRFGNYYYYYFFILFFFV